MNGSADPHAVPDQEGFRVRGRVQGVGFRWWTRQQALRLGLQGTVRNADDGSVEVWARGSADSLVELRKLLERGPPGSDVLQVEPLSSEPRWRGDGFHIVR